MNGGREKRFSIFFFFAPEKSSLIFFPFLIQNRIYFSFHIHRDKNVLDNNRMLSKKKSQIFTGNWEKILKFTLNWQKIPHKIPSGIKTEKILIKIYRENTFLVTFHKTVLLNWTVGSGKTWTWIFARDSITVMTEIFCIWLQRRRVRRCSVWNRIFGSHWEHFDENSHPFGGSVHSFPHYEAKSKNSHKDKLNYDFNFFFFNFSLPWGKILQV